MKAGEVKKIKTKTPSQKVRAILYLHWELKSTEETFDEFYKREMDKIIDSLKKAYLK
jgi:hypothetical protein